MDRVLHAQNIVLSMKYSVLCPHPLNWGPGPGPGALITSLIHCRVHVNLALIPCPKLGVYPGSGVPRFRPRGWVPTANHILNTFKAPHDLGPKTVSRGW